MELQLFHYILKICMYKRLKYFITVKVYTVRPLLSAELDYARFLRPKFGTPNLYEVQWDLHYPHLYYPRTSVIRGFWDQKLVRPSTVDSRGLTVVILKINGLFDNPRTKI